MAQDKGVLERGVLPFSLQQQEALMGYLITDELFLIQVSKRVKPTWFENALLGSIYLKLVTMLERVGRAPISPEEFKGEFLSEEANEINRIHSLIDQCVLYRTNFGLDLIKKDLNKIRLKHHQVLS